MYSALVFDVSNLSIKESTQHDSRTTIQQNQSKFENNFWIFKTCLLRSSMLSFIHTNTLKKRYLGISCWIQLDYIASRSKRTGWLLINGPPLTCKFDLFFFVLTKTYEECLLPRTYNMVNEWFKPYQYQITSLLLPKTFEK